MESSMKASKFSEAQIAFVLKQGKRPANPTYLDWFELVISVSESG